MGRKKKKTRNKKSPFRKVIDSGIRLSRFQSKMEKLASLVEQNQQAHCDMTLNPGDGTVYWPEPWVEAMAAVPALRHEIGKLTPLPVEKLAPMFPELRDLCRYIGLPVYQGKAPPIVHEAPNQPHPSGSDPRSRERCSRCGDKLKPLGHRHIREALDQNMGVFTSPTKAQEFVDGEIEAQKNAPLVCKNCGV